MSSVHDLSAWNCDEPYDGPTYRERSCPVCAGRREDADREASTAMRRYVVRVATHPADPDDDVVLEEVVVGSFDQRTDAVDIARRVSVDERTYTLVHDTQRTSKITNGPVLIAMFERGRG